MLKSLFQTLLAVFSSLAVLGSLFWLMLSFLWLYLDKGNKAILPNWTGISIVAVVLALGVAGLVFSIKKIKAERQRVREKMKVVDKIELN